MQQLTTMWYFPHISLKCIGSPKSVVKRSLQSMKLCNCIFQNTSAPLSMLGSNVSDIKCHTSQSSKFKNIPLLKIQPAKMLVSRTLTTSYGELLYTGQEYQKIKRKYAPKS